jgi:phosphonate transport system permease protein
VEEPKLVKPEALRRKERWNLALGLGVVLSLAASYHAVEMSPGRLVAGARDAWELLGRFFPLEFQRWQTYSAAMRDTVFMALWGSFLATFLALPFAFCAARNVVPRVVYLPVRALMDGMRGVSEFALALIFVAAIGLGPFPGIIALTLHTAAVVGKLLSESIETADRGQIEAVQAAGSRPLQVLTHGYWPQIAPMFASFTLYHFEVNVRAATVLGLVGAGGIGFYLQESMRSFSFDEAAAVMSIIVASVFVIDKASAWLRQRLL